MGVVHDLVDEGRCKVGLADGIAGRRFSGSQVKEDEWSACLNGFQLTRHGLEKRRRSDRDVTKGIVVVVVVVVVVVAAAAFLGHFGQCYFQFFLGVLKLQRVGLLQLGALDAVSTQQNEAPGPGLSGGLGNVETGLVIDRKGFPGSPVPGGQATHDHIDRSGLEQQRRR